MGYGSASDLQIYRKMQYFGSELYQILEEFYIPGFYFIFSGDENE